MLRTTLVVLAFASALLAAPSARAGEETPPVLTARDVRAADGFFTLSFGSGLAPETSTSSRGGLVTDQFTLGLTLGGFSQIAPFFGMGFRMPFVFHTRDYGSSQSAFLLVLTADLLFGVPVGPVLAYGGIGGGIGASLYKPSSTGDRVGDKTYVWNWIAGLRLQVLRELSLAFEVVGYNSGSAEYKARSTKGWENNLVVRIPELMGTTFSFVLAVHFSGS